MEDLVSLVFQCRNSNEMASLLQGASELKCEALSLSLLNAWEADPDSRDQVSFLFVQLATAFDKSDRPARGVSLVQSVVTHAREVGNDAMLASALGTLGLLQMHAGQLPEAQEIFHETIAVSTVIGDTETIVRCLVNLGIMESNENRNVTALVQFQEALQLAVSCNDATGEESARQNQTITAKKVLWSWVECPAEELPQTVVPYMNEELIAAVLSELPELVRFLSTEQQGVGLTNVFNCVSNLGNLFLRTERFEKAYEMFQKAFHIAELLGRKQQIGESLLNAASVSVCMQNDVLAFETFDRCLVIARQNNLSNVEASCLISRGALYERHNRLKEAGGDYTLAAEIANRFRMHKLEHLAQAGLKRISR